VPRESQHTEAPSAPGPRLQSDGATIAIVLNGDAFTLPHGSHVDELLVRLDLAQRRLAVAINHEVLPRSGRARRILESGDRVEILEAVGGG